MKILWPFLLILSFNISLAQQSSIATPPAPTGDADKVTMRRVASVYVAETFINEQIKKFGGKSELLKDLHLDMDAKKDHLYLTGRLQLPLDLLQTANIDRHQGEFKFQLAIKPRATKEGHLKLEFPLSETFFYQASSRNPNRDRVVVPVHLLSLAVASMRGYIAALSGDFSSFDKKMEKQKIALREVKRNIGKETKEDALIDLGLQKKSIELQIESLKVERLQIERTAKSLANILSFLGEEQVNLNDEIEATENSITLKVRIGRIIPYLKDIKMAGLRVSHDAKDGDGEDYLVMGVDSALEVIPPKAARQPRKERVGMKIPPSMLIRINQSVFNSKAVIAAQKEKLGDNVQDLDVALKEDGVHVTGKVKKFFMTIPFDTTVDFVTTEPDVFEVRLRELNVRGFDFKFLTKYVLDAIKERLDKALAGICTFEYLGEKDESQVLRVKVEPKNLVPAFPDLHLVAVDVGNREFLLKVGRIEGEAK
ncbi:hypothetical protein AZI86_07830 [Bdellovibrio bacteriovorus]|uniref:Uncharacterized protein n=1 Tax=Bdellovibrio bacteriovorus TaxID=959 RepID=A0A150WRC6_BDEBC|nr:hypothetical protein [Bdellovibrio bacteriovorus]KYG66926.1 hypothetical protein AZI86_07830 [Bdellovibrio bacteriovorus]